MFNSARLKLTAWYLLVIMLVSISFSVVVFRIEVAEIERLVLSSRFNLPPEIIEEVVQRRITSLVLINLGILVAAGTLGYFLAGRTLRPIKEMVEEQNRFIGDASHELRTPLTSLKSAMEVNLRDKNLTVKEAKQLLNDSLGEVNKLQYLSESLLQLAHQQKPADQKKFDVVSLAEIIKNAIKTIEPKAKQKNVTLKSDLIEVDVQADKYGLTDLVVILLDNAIKYSHPEGQVVISTKKTDGGVLIRVEDFGIGIEKEALPHVFDRFFRADSARVKSDSGGYGLGLSIAKKIVEDHHGSINIESIHNKGTVVSVLL